MIMMNTLENQLHVDAKLDGRYLADLHKDSTLGCNIFRLWSIARDELIQRYGHTLVEENAHTVREAFIEGWKEF